MFVDISSWVMILVAMNFDPMGIIVDEVSLIYNWNNHDQVHPHVMGPGGFTL